MSRTILVLNALILLANAGITISAVGARSGPQRAAPNRPVAAVVADTRPMRREPTVSERLVALRKLVVCFDSFPETERLSRAQVGVLKRFLVRCVEDMEAGAAAVVDAAGASARQRASTLLAAVRRRIRSDLMHAGVGARAADRLVSIVIACAA